MTIGINITPEELINLKNDMFKYKLESEKTLKKLLKLVREEIQRELNEAEMMEQVLADDNS